MSGFRSRRSGRPGSGAGTTAEEGVDDDCSVERNAWIKETAFHTYIHSYVPVKLLVTDKLMIETPGEGRRCMTRGWRSSAEDTTLKGPSG